MYKRQGEIEQFSAEKFIIAVGTKPYRPEQIPFDGTRIFDSDEILKIKRLPRSLAVIGGGVIGVEYATIFSALDIPITLIEARDTILDFVDKEIIAELMHELRERGVAMRLGCNIKEVQKILSMARDKIAKDLNLIDEDKFAFCWIVDYPMFELDEKTKKIKFSHNPFSMPHVASKKGYG